MPQRNDRSRSTPTTSPKNNSWFRMQAGHQSDADIYIYDEIGFWGVTAKQFISDLNALGDITHINLHINSPGGDVFEGIAIFNALKTHGASITVYVRLCRRCGGVNGVGHCDGGKPGHYAGKLLHDDS